MTFSLSPSSVSTLPLTAASVSTRVVSWNEAAEMNERVCSEALVMPSSTGWPDRLLLAFLLRAGVDLVHLDLVDLLALDQVGLAGIVDLDLLQHLANDHLDVLVVDGDALQPVDLLDLVDQIGGELLDALDRQDVVRGGVALDDGIALLDHVAILQVDVLALGDQVFLGLLVLAVGLDDDRGACSCSRVRSGSCRRSPR